MKWVMLALGVGVAIALAIEMPATTGRSSTRTCFAPPA